MIFGCFARNFIDSIIRRYNWIKELLLGSCLHILQLEDIGKYNEKFAT